MNLSRDIHRWLQGLDLTYEIKNPKRDLTNGFTVAEIYSCYFPADVEMFSFENATSLPRKLANWELLYKFFRKREVPVSRELINDVVHAKGGAAIALLEATYVFLTNKTPIRTKQVAVGAGAAAQIPEELPPFAKPTASKLVKEAMTDTEIAATRDAGKVVAQKNQQLIEEHDKLARIERAKRDPLNALYGQSGPAVAKRQTLKGPQAVPAPEHPQSAQGVMFREVQVRTCEVDPLILRTRGRTGTPRTPSAAGESRPQSGIPSPSAPDSLPSVSKRSLRQLLSAGGAALSMMSSSIEGTLLAAEYSGVKMAFDGWRGGTLAAFVDSLPWLPAGVVAAAFRDLQNSTPFVVDALLRSQHGKELSTLVVALLVCHEQLPSAQGVMFREVQVRTCEVDPLILRTRGRTGTPRTPSAAGESRPQSGIPSPSAPDSLPSVSKRSLRQLLSAGGAALSMMSSSIEGTLLAAEYSGVKMAFDGWRGGTLAAFVDSLPWLPAGVVAAAFRDLQNSTPFVVDALLRSQHGKELSTLVVALLVCHEQLPVSSAGAATATTSASASAAEQIDGALEAASRAMAQKDAAVAWAVFEHSALPLIADFVIGSPVAARARAAAAALRPFCSAGDASSVLDALCIALGDDRLAYAACLHSLSHHRGGADEMSASTVASYTQEALACLQEDNPAVVSLAIASLYDLAKSSSSTDSLRQLLGALSQTASRVRWWEVQAHLAMIACELLRRADQSDAAEVAALASAVQDAVARSQSPAVTAVALQALSNCVNEGSALCGTVAVMLMALPLEAVRSMLSPAAATGPISQCTELAAFVDDEHYWGAPLASLWGDAAVSIAAALAETMASGSVAQEMHPCIAAVTCACIAESDTGDGTLDRESLPQWQAAFAAVREAVFMELCSEQGCDTAARALSIIVPALEESVALDSFGLLLAALTLVFGTDGTMELQRRAGTWLLRSLAGRGGVYQTAVANLLHHAPPEIAQAPEVASLLGAH
eukprot:m51a1_g6746 hypothetical protein (996) ;mRNA; r:267163-270571